MGIDCFGRNTFGGGMFESHVAMEAAYNAGEISKSQQAALHLGGRRRGEPSTFQSTILTGNMINRCR